MSYNIFLCGVGGQGLVLLTNVIGSACAKSGLKAVTGEMYGLSQRSGSVFVHLRIGENVYSPLIPYASADLLLSLEAIEGLRYLEFLKKDGVVLLNNRIVHPPIETSKLVTDKTAKYVTIEEIVARLQSWTSHVALVDALNLAKLAGNAIAENSVFLGCLSAIKAFPVEENAILESISEAVPKKTVEQNISAFKLGKKAAYESLCNSLECRAPE
jgi:indolepyruvate ferredoxin oxidoreductase, beta subunit